MTPEKPRTNPDGSKTGTIEQMIEDRTGFRVVSSEAGPPGTVTMRVTRNGVPITEPVEVFGTPEQRAETFAKERRHAAARSVLDTLGMVPTKSAMKYAERYVDTYGVGLEPFDQDPPAEVPSLDGARFELKGFDQTALDAAVYVRAMERAAHPDRRARDYAPEAVARRKALLDPDPVISEADRYFAAIPYRVDLGVVADEADPYPSTYSSNEARRRRALPAAVKAAADRAEESARQNKARRRW